MNVPSEPSDELIQQTIDTFWETFPPLWNHLQSNLRDNAAEKYNITAEQFHILRLIRKNCNTISQLAEAKQTSRSNISQSVDILVDKGLVLRQDNPDDRRFVTLALSPAGSELIAALYQKNRRWMAGRMAQLSPAELQQVTLALKTLYRLIEE